MVWENWPQQHSLIQRDARGVATRHEGHNDPSVRLDKCAALLRWRGGRGGRRWWGGARNSPSPTLRETKALESWGPVGRGWRRVHDFFACGETAALGGSSFGFLGSRRRPQEVAEATLGQDGGQGKNGRGAHAIAQHVVGRWPTEGGTHVTSASRSLSLLTRKPEMSYGKEAPCAADPRVLWRETVAVIAADRFGGRRAQTLTSKESGQLVWQANCKEATRGWANGAEGIKWLDDDMLEALRSDADWLRTLGDRKPDVWSSGGPFERLRIHRLP